jgi:hypothetical protein
MLTRSLLILTLPSRPNAVHVQVWRALKAMGCAAPSPTTTDSCAAGAVFDALDAGASDRGGMLPARRGVTAIVPSPAPLSRQQAARVFRPSP